MAGYVRVLRGTFDSAQLAPATSLAGTVAQELRNTFEHFDHLETLSDGAGHFIWLAYFMQQTPLTGLEIDARFAELQELARSAGVAFDIEEFGVYDVTYTGPGQALS